MALVLRAIHADGSEKEVKIMPIDQVRFEAHFSVSWNNAAQDMSNTMLLWVCHAAARRAGQTTLEFEPWVETVEDVAFGEASKKSSRSATQ